MRTLVFDPDPLRARAYAARVGTENGGVDVVTSPQQAAHMMQSGAYSRLAMRVEQTCPSGQAVLDARQSLQPTCSLVDVARMPGRAPTGQGGAVVVPVPTPTFLSRRDSLLD